MNENMVSFDVVWMGTRRKYTSNPNPNVRDLSDDRTGAGEARERTHDFDTTQTRRSALGSSDYCVVGVYEEEEEGRMFVQGALAVDQRVDAEWWQVSDSRLGSYELRGSFYFFRSITIGFCPATHRAHKVRSRNPRSSLRIDSSGISFRSFLPPITPPVRR